MKEKILVSTSSFAEVSKLSLNMLNDSGYQIILNPHKRRLTNEELIDLLDENVIGIIAGLEELSENTLGKSRIKAISRVGSGITNIEMEYVEKNNIKIFVTPNAPINAVAEMTVMNILNLLRHTIYMNNNLHNNEWIRKIGGEIKNKNVVIFGCGKIGKRVFNLLKPFNAKVYFVDPFYDGQIDGLNIIEKNEALKIADVITIHVNRNETVLSNTEFELMKKGVIVLNSARGKCILEEDLIVALENKTVNGAWIDTFDDEPYTGDLIKYKNVILTPHTASFTKECRSEMELEATNNLLNYLNNR
tara:strand:+ start:286 stop:1197 length:912 start_codon:yes stop_codon:yes gene_type:complete